MHKKISRIGVFDSGIGGLTVLKCLLELIPGVDMVYLGDSARLPYGTKSSRTIIGYSLQCAKFLVTKDIDMLVVACNTASAYAIPALKEEFNIPVIGVVEAGSRAVTECDAKRIGVIGTSATIKSHAYEETIRSLKPGLEIFTQACPLFVPLVEEGWYDDEITEQVVRRYMKTLMDARIDTLLLGCTHYPLLKGVLSKVMGEGVSIVDSALSTARLVKGIVGIGDDRLTRREIIYYLSDSSPRFIELGEHFLGREMKYVYDVDLCV
ncbi:MAG TPA: glutamate racemase [Desulfomonilia bacterium]|nr:glutamate racemase [Desulfomonilia bacterium]